MQTTQGITLAEAAVAEIRRRRWVVPPVRVIERMVSEAATRAQRRVFQLLTDSLSNEQRSALARDQFGVFRAQRDYQTQRKGKRASATRPITYTTEAGERKTKVIPIKDYPNAYISVSYAPPGILTGAEPSDGSPAMNVATVYDPKEMERAVAAIGEPVLQIETSLSFDWRPFSLTLAKIAHSFLVAVLGTRGYIAFLPQLIIGEPGTGFLSYYVGGYGANPPPEWMFARHHVQLKFEPLMAPYPGLCAVAHIALVRGARMSTFQVVAARITDHSVVEKAAKNPVISAYNQPGPAVAPA